MPRASSSKASSVAVISPPAGDGVQLSEPNGDSNGARPRRSGRVTKRPMTYHDDENSDELGDDAKYGPSNGAAGTETPAKKKVKVLLRRNPKCEAEEVAEEEVLAESVPGPPNGLAVPSEDEILDRAFHPLHPKELEQWRGWADFESEPSFFNSILRKLGVKDAKIQEIWGMDEDSFAVLPKPLYGLIFLYKFMEEDDEELREDCPPHVWFANQTTSNACATVAMVNIAMNCQNLHLGEKLSKFKSATRRLNPALRGHLLATDPDIRTAHNSFARRLDVLVSDMTLRNELREAEKKALLKERAERAAMARPRKRRGSSSQQQQQQKKRKQPDRDAAFHFIAYVPIGEQVWEFNGMQQNPLCIATLFPDEDWAAAARSRITSRIREYEDYAVFNLLGFCHSPLDSLRQELAGNIRRLQILDHQIRKIKMSQNKSDSKEKGEIAEETTLPTPGDDSTAGESDGSAEKWTNGSSDSAGAHSGLLDGNSDDAALAEYKLTWEDVEEVAVPPTYLAESAISSASPSAAAAAASLRCRLTNEQRRMRDEYEAEVRNEQDDAARVAGRRKDYTPALHGWVKKLAELGVLRELAEDVRQ